MKEFLIIIPVRGGSKGIPRKNLRPLLNKPLISYSINLCSQLITIADVIVSSDDDELIEFSKSRGIQTHRRPAQLANDSTTLDPVIFNCFEAVSKNKNYKYVITLQATSPLLKVETLRRAIDFASKNDADTVISMIDDRHLTWRKEENTLIPNYTERKNRQELPENYRETGAFVITKTELIRKKERISGRIIPFIVSKEESIDIDDNSDFKLAEFYLKRKKILIVVCGNSLLGLGHVYNTLILANDLIGHEIEFLAITNSKMAQEFIAKKNYPCHYQKDESLIQTIDKINPDIVINDILDTEEGYIQELKALKKTVINFEDLGRGSKVADLVFNPIYPEEIKVKNHFFGPRYFLLRDEFINNDYKALNPEVRKVLLTFGGVDPLNLTRRVLEAIYSYCENRNIQIDVILGFGYDKLDTLLPFENISIHRNVNNMAKRMSEADIIFSSAGRTIYEIASTGRPCIVLAQHEREMTHFFASEKFGFINLGIGSEIKNYQILEKFSDLCESKVLRYHLSKLMLSTNLKGGRKLVQQKINKLIDEKYS